MTKKRVLNWVCPVVVFTGLGVAGLLACNSGRLAGYGTMGVRDIDTVPYYAVLFARMVGIASAGVALFLKKLSPVSRGVLLGQGVVAVVLTVVFPAISIAQSQKRFFLSGLARRAQDLGIGAELSEWSRQGVETMVRSGQTESQFLGTNLSPKVTGLFPGQLPTTTFSLLSVTGANANFCGAVIYRDGFARWGFRCGDTNCAWGWTNEAIVPFLNGMYLFFGDVYE